MKPIADSDSELVESSLGGDHEAFGRIVERYGWLVRNVAFGATGNSALSEDVAQETFIAAWQGLAGLHQPVRLRAWLCAITRNLARNARRQWSRSVLGRTVPLDSVAEPECPALNPHGEAVKNEREAILWHALGDVPVVYREAMILYYREGKPVREVAAALGVAENAAKQRLLRGRRHLQAQVSLLVDETLRTQAPSSALPSPFAFRPYPSAPALH